MLALTIALALVVLLLTVLVAGLLRSHADILRALHDVGAGVGDPSAIPDTGPRTTLATPAGLATAPGVQGAAVPLHMGPPLPGERDSVSAPDVSGVSPRGDGVAVVVSGVPTFTLLAFLSSGCATCAGFWAALQHPATSGVPSDIRVVAVTKGPEFEIAPEVARRAGPIDVIMSTPAWNDYEVPGSPFFVLIDGRRGRRVGEGVANELHQVADLVRRARAEAEPPTGGVAGSESRAHATGLDGKARESRNDQELIAAGVLPGDPSLYPKALDDVIAPSARRDDEGAS